MSGGLPDKNNWQKKVVFTVTLMTQIPPAWVVVMWFMDRDSSMLLDMEACRGALQGSGGSSRGGCRLAGLSDSSVLLGWHRDRDGTGTWGSETRGARGGATGKASASALDYAKRYNIKNNSQDMSWCHNSYDNEHE